MIYIYLYGTVETIRDNRKLIKFNKYIRYSPIPYVNMVKKIDLLCNWSIYGP